MEPSFQLSVIAYASIPVVSAFIGWFTNWVAIKMTFYPIRFVGIPPFLGWQGIIPRKAAKIAGKAVDLITSRLVAERDVVREIDGQGLVADLLATLAPAFDELARRVMARQGGPTWDAMPTSVRADVLARIREEFAETLRDLGDELTQRIGKYLDLRALVVENLTGDSARTLNDIFLRCGSKEFRFIELSGLYIGGALGVAQAALWQFYPRWWLLPLAGIVVGYVTNWVALKMIFRPLHPTRYLLFTYQGMFLRRQDEISKEYADLVATRVVTAPRIVARFMSGPANAELRERIEHHVGRAIDRATDIFKGPLGVLLVTMTPEMHQETKRLAWKTVAEKIPACALVVQRHLTGTMDLVNLIYPRLRTLPKPEFEEILHACFREDEFLLIAVGGLLGFLVGLVQVVYLAGFQT